MALVLHESMLSQAHLGEQKMNRWQTLCIIHRIINGAIYGKNVRYERIHV